jgi:hypothetical protein
VPGPATERGRQLRRPFSIKVSNSNYAPNGAYNLGPKFDHRLIVIEILMLINIRSLLSAIVHDGYRIANSADPQSGIKHSSEN